jgi:putative transposase
MKRSKFSEGQIIKILKETEITGKIVTDVCREHGIAQSTYYKWKSKYGGLDESQLRRLNELEEENRKLKRMYADLSLDHMILKDIIEKTFLIPEKRQLVQYVIDTHKATIRRVCRMVQLNRDTFYYQHTKPDDAVIKGQLTGLASDHPRWGAKKMTAVIRNQGNQVNHKRIRRIYREMQLNICIKPKKRLPSREPVPLIVPEKPNQSWPVDFMRDALLSGQGFRTFNVIDDFNREVLWISTDTSIPSPKVIRILDQIAGYRGYPR